MALKQLGAAPSGPTDLVPNVGRVTGQVNTTVTNVVLWSGTQAQFNALGSYPAGLYAISG